MYKRIYLLNQQKNISVLNMAVTYVTFYPTL